MENLMKKETCKHKWTQVFKHSRYGVVYQDVCGICGCIGVISNVPDEHGVYQIVPKNLAEVIDLNQYRQKRKVQANGKINPGKRGN